jgi:phytoene desaturase
MANAIVIGAGIGGLASAVRLACLGYKVKVFEANSFIGGKINSEYKQGYRFDMGPSVFTGPEYILDLYQLCGKDFNSFKYKKLDYSFHYFYPDGTRFALPAQQSEQIEALSQGLGEAAETIQKYLEKSKLVYELTKPVFIEASLNRWQQILKPKLLKTIVNIPKYKLNKTMHEENKSTFKQTKAVQFFNRYATYNGSDPYQAPAMLNMIPHLELNVGAYLPEKGMAQITQSIYELAIEKGVTFHLNEKVEEIIIEAKGVKGVKTAKGEYLSDIVFSNMDVSFTYEKLMPHIQAPKKILSQEKSSSAIVFYWGIKKNFKELHVHNILFAKDYEAEFKAIFTNKTLYEDPTIYINITSKAIASDAPAGGENWFTMINAPVNTGQDWKSIVSKARQILIQKINHTLNTDIEKYIEVEDVMDPVLIEQKYSGKQGSIYGNASNNKFSAFLRHPNFSNKIRGLYFVGVTVHPGGGIPLALNSAKIAVDCLKKDFSIKDRINDQY